ncbi:uncharacterized protein LOC108910126 [Anoplophora glabripennis]|uniref:uncharacterized protein LOC108910126 n=1 Tax=Anoplophora glabripennis TaxID=217634 RepID=UPI00087520C7|nr:uncharacterized protein LOC108910126 [Anoplophora glabripennis]
MKLLVLAALAAVALADASQLAGYQYNVPASSYGVPQSSVTERYLNAVPTAPPLGLNLPAFEHQDFNALNPLPGVVVSTTAAPFIDTGFVSSTPAPSVDSGLIVSSTPAPSVVGGAGLDLNAQLPGLASGFSYTTPAPSLSFNSGGLDSVGQLGLGSGFVSSTSAPHIQVTSGSQENLNADVHLANFGFNSGLSGFTTPAPTLFSSTVAPTVSTLAPGFGLGLGSAYNFPGFGLNAFSTPAPIGLLGSGINFHGITSGGSISDAFGGSSATVSAGILPQPQQVSKHLYFYAAPEDPEPARTRINVAPVAPPKKNVKVIFIKAPTPPAPPQINIAAPPQDEEKTVVYVLVKKAEDTQNIEIQTPPPTAPAKPEVYFIKYKTQQEAEEAIAKVQNNHDEGSGNVVGTINGGSLLSTVPTLPIVNYVSSTTTPSPLLSFIGGGISGPIQNSGLTFSSTTTPAPFFNFVGGGISGPIQNSGFALSPQVEDTDISQNLISSGGQTSSLFSTGSPLISSLAPSGSFIGTTTVAPPLVPHSTYGPPALKK